MNDLTVTLEADTDEFVDNIDDAREAVEDLEAALQRLNEALDSLDGQDVAVTVTEELRSSGFNTTTSTE